ncbi:MAG: outer membrane lipoprotein carrier protein LolA [Bacteroidetes bacterium]|nr:outer membrane lipoprotein carrier protein LolA [Bacteroidota bacterium]
MRKTFLFIISSIIAIGSFAQKDKKATEILDRVIAKTESYKTMEVEFTLAMVNVEADIHDNKNGVLLVMGDKYKLTLSEQIVISDGKTMWTLLLENKEVMINDVEENEESITPTNLLNSYSDNYKSTYLKEDVINGKKVDLIELTPLKGKIYTKIEVAIEKGMDQIYSFSMFDKNGSTYSYTIKKYNLNKKVGEFEFVFNEAKYPNFEIVDMR